MSRHIQELSPVSMAVFCLVLFELLQDKNVVIAKDSDRKSYSLAFEKIFEIISAYAISADVEGVIWWTGKSRDRVSFLRQLNKVIRKTGYGTLKTVEQLEANQVGVNDGGVDVLALTTLNGNVQPDAMCYLVGATYQKASRRGKIVGPAELERLRGFFLHLPNMTFQGVLSIPYPYVLAEANDCRDQNCRYFPLGTIEKKIGHLNARDDMGESKTYRKLLDSQMVIKGMGVVNQVSVVIGGGEIRMSDFMDELGVA